MTTRTTPRRRIKVPPEAVRTRDQSLEGVELYRGKYVLVTCQNCGGSGHYPSSATPPGRCRFYCWADPTGHPLQPHRPKRPGDPTYGKRLVPVDEYVKRAQKRDRADYRAKVRAAQAKAEYVERFENPDARAVALAEAFGWQLDALPPRVNDAADPAWFALSLLSSHLAHGELTEGQWDFAAALPDRKREREERSAELARQKAASRHVGRPGERLRKVPATLEWFRSFVVPGRFRGTTTSRTLFKFRAGDDLLVWWTSSWPFPPHGPRAADELPLAVTLSGTVKSHTEYDGERQTELTRVALEVAAPSPNTEETT